ncbi:MAG: hypothetical protein ACRCSN_05980 [Dermatophilaceae bacterium]
MTSLDVGIPVVVLLTAVLLLRIGLPPGDRDVLRGTWSRLARSRRNPGTTE